MWEIEFFEKNNGRCPVNDFLGGLNKKTDIPFIIDAMDQLEKNGNRLRRPQVDYLRDDIWELRVRTRNSQFRFFYFFL